MGMATQARDFKPRAVAAMGDPALARALARMPTTFQRKRAAARDALPEFETLRDEAAAIRAATLDNLDSYLSAFEAQATAAGSHVHWARDDAEARERILDICRAAGAGTVAKGKSMIAEEIGLGHALSGAGMTPIETDLGEYIIQLREEPPSHIVAPAFHLSKEDAAEAFRAAHTDRDADRDLSTPPRLMAEARAELRRHFLNAAVGITGANQLVAETGSAVIVTNEGNGDLAQTLPPVQIVLASIEKVVPTLADSAALLRVLARSATGQDTTVYTSYTTGPARSGEPDGPREVHVVLVDNGRSPLLGTAKQDVLRCIRCGACINHCPIYAAIGGHAYGSPYPGPIGAALSPALAGVAETHHLPHASSFCGRCEAVCPVRIPLPKIMRHWREDAYQQRLAPPAQRGGLGLFALLARHPGLYRAATRLAVGLLARLARGRGGFRSFPFAGGWTSERRLPAPANAQTFQAQWRRYEHQRRQPT